MWKSRDKEKGEEKSQRDYIWIRRQNTTTLDNQWTSRQRANAKEVQSKSLIDKDRTDKSSAMKMGKENSSQRSR